jgi:hypothetical protein
MPLKVGIGGESRAQRKGENRVIFWMTLIFDKGIQSLLIRE